MTEVQCDTAEVWQGSYGYREGVLPEAQEENVKHSELNFKNMIS